MKERKKEDKRITKTKEQLTAALVELMTEKRFEDITVNELCTKADVRRATFYKHFEDKYAFITSVAKMMRDRFDERRINRANFIGTKEYYTEYVTRLVEYIHDAEAISKRVLESEIKHRVIFLIVQQNWVDTKARLEQDVTDGRFIIPASIDVTTDMIVGGCAAAVIRWLESGMNKDKYELAAEICGIIDYILDAPPPPIEIEENDEII